MEVRVLDHFKLSNAVIAARTCWNSFHKGGNYREPTDTISEADKELLERLLFQHKHMSIAEHCVVVFETEEELLIKYFTENNFSYVRGNYAIRVITTNLRVLLESSLPVWILQEITPKEWHWLFEKLKKNLSYISSFNFGTKYSVDKTGQVYLEEVSPYHKHKEGKPLKSFVNKYGYIEYNLQVEDRSKVQHIQAHRLVALCFIPNPENKPHVNHIDGNKTNNHISNLEWCTASENEQHSYDFLGKVNAFKGKSRPSGKDYLGTIRKVGKFSLEGVLLKEYFNPTEAEMLDGFSLKAISNVCCGRSKTHKGFIWKYL